MLELMLNHLSTDMEAYFLALVSTIASCGLANLWDTTVVHDFYERTIR